MKESLNDIIDRLDKDNKSIKRDLSLNKESSTKQISELKNEIEELKSMIKALKPNPIKALTDKDIKLSIDNVVTQDYITNLYRNK